LISINAGQAGLARLYDRRGSPRRPPVSGITRASFGAQDFSPHLQQAIGRVQLFVQVEVGRSASPTSVST
jgi:hypothetical protein